MTPDHIATRQGTGENNADAGAVFTSETGVTAVCVVDMIGHASTAPAVGQLLAETAVRVGAQRGPLAGLLAAAMLVADPGAGDEPEPDGVAVLAVARPGRPVELGWVGDCQAYGWDGRRLAARTDPHTMGTYLGQYGMPPVPEQQLAAAHDAWVRTTLATATATSVALSEAPAGELLVLVSDGVYEQIPHERIERLLREHAETPQALAGALVAAAAPGADGDRDDATAAVIYQSGQNW
jgi:PPM family protein phosphatase